MTISSLQTLAELEKLEALIGELPAPTRELAGACHPGQIRQTRDAILDELHRSAAATFGRLGRLVGALPTKRAAALAEHCGATVAAGTLPFVDALKVGKIARRLPVALLTEITLISDPRALRGLIRHIPAEQLAGVAVALIEQRQYVRAGQLADALPAAVIRQVLALVSDDVALLRTIFYMDEPDKLGDIIRLIDNDRLNRIILSGLGNQDAWPILIWVIDQVGRDIKSRITNLIVERDPGTLNELINVANAHAWWGPILRSLDTIKERHQRSLVHLQALRDEQVLEGLMKAAHDEGLMANTLPLIAAMNSDLQAFVAKVGLRQGADILESFIRDAVRQEHADLVLTLIGRMSDEEVQELTTLEVFTDNFILRAMVASGISTGQIRVLIRFARRLPRKGQELIASLMAADHGALLERLLNRSELLGNNDWNELVTLISRVRLPDQAREIADVIRYQSRQASQALKTHAENMGMDLLKALRQ
ncbi:MAG: hypothetical protein ACPHQ9_00810 [Marinobacter sp.]|uniref:hypothetical protein n=1 Tax=Marinobacter sp. TaxID=50741 RepID=UPI003C3F6C0E